LGASQANKRFGVFTKFMTREKSKGQHPLKPLNPEQVYQLMAQRKWSELIILLHDYHKVIPLDPSLEAAFKTFESELNRNFDEFRQDDKFEQNLSYLNLIQSAKFYSFSDMTVKKLTIELVKLYDSKGNIEQAHYFASRLPQDSFCASVIEKYTQTLPKVVMHSQSQSIRVTENKDISAANHTISLFKSPQEHDFFMAVREVFPLYIVYPNVALSTLVNFDKIQSNLSSDEKDYFFRAVVDCVVFDQHKEYIPIYFFELDSSSHDNEKQQAKDKIKDKILAIAGQKLYRIRKLSHSQGQNEFMQLVREVVLH
jgi:hypothetical protein